MAETRKHHVTVRDELDAAIRAALGEPVRPITPGGEPATTSSDETAGAEVTPHRDAAAPAHDSTLARFTFGTPTHP